MPAVRQCRNALAKIVMPTERSRMLPPRECPSPISGSGAIVAADSFVYVLSDRWILGYSVDAATGKLNPLPASAGQNPGVLLPLNTAMTMVADPNGAFS